VLRRGQARITTEIGSVHGDATRAQLYNLHKAGRGLRVPGDEPLSATAYEMVLADSCCESFELRFHVEGELIGVAIVDRSERALSAVYCYYDPSYAALSPGVYSILMQLELCRRWNLEYLYLGLTVHGAPAMTYKRTYLPQERLIDGRWVRFERSPQGLA
jgi:arginine-tRNA-protein transferase